MTEGYPSETLDWRFEAGVIVRTMVTALAILAGVGFAWTAPIVWVGIPAGIIVAVGGSLVGLFVGALTSAVLGWDAPPAPDARDELLALQEGGPP